MYSLMDPSKSPLPIVIGVVAVFLAVEIVRYQRHIKALASIPTRIHINGSRGKSSVTRLIGAVLRGGKDITVTKTTGTTPRLICPDGREIPVFRAGKANIIEQVKIVSHAAKLGARALVVECMAITPEYITTLERKLIKSTIGVITNVREDHLDVMGPTTYDVAANLARSLPTNSLAFTAEHTWFSVLEKEAQKRGSKLVCVDAESVTDEDMKGFSYVEHKENVALALAIAEQFNVPRETALQSMYQAVPDPGAMREYTILAPNGKVRLLNALAANDPDSSVMIWNNACRQSNEKKIAIMILRADRLQRTESFARILEDRLVADTYVIAGTGLSFVVSALKKRGVGPERIIGLEDPSSNDLLDALLEQVNGDSIAVAMGNIVGLGDDFINKAQTHAQKQIA